MRSHPGAISHPDELHYVIPSWNFILTKFKLHCDISSRHIYRQDEISHRDEITGTHRDKKSHWDGISLVCNISTKDFWSNHVKQETAYAKHLQKKKWCFCHGQKSEKWRILSAQMVLEAVEVTCPTVSWSVHALLVRSVMLWLSSTLLSPICLFAYRRQCMNMEQ